MESETNYEVSTGLRRRASLSHGPPRRVKKASTQPFFHSKLAVVKSTIAIWHERALIPLELAIHNSSLESCYFRLVHYLLEF